MKTIVLDDDPTGTQSASGVTVLLSSDADRITDALREADSVYVQTNSRALPEAEAVALVTRIKADGEEASRRLGDRVRFVLRGDSTLRGHVFAETEVFLDDDAVMLFAPAFPEGGRTTRGGVHYVKVDGADVPAHESEYASDPVFGFSSGHLAEFVSEKSGRATVTVPLSEVRAGGLARILVDAPRGSVVVPDAVTAQDITDIATATEAAAAGGRRIVVRSASPLAAEIAGVTSRGLLPMPLVDGEQAVLLVCGSHTLGATAQLRPVLEHWDSQAVIETDAALEDPVAAGTAAAETAAASFHRWPVVVVSTERRRSAEHNTLDHGEKVMAALTTAVRALMPNVSVVVSKGGITSAEVARVGIGATSATVLGQVLPGVSVWRMTAYDSREILYVVVPGNVGGQNTLMTVLEAVGIRPQERSASGAGGTG
ncbi:four-carbon acid sugar kinase family protein [Okibacterium endophyticum]